MDQRPEPRPLLVYLNVPFCNSKCHFCDWVAQVPVRDLRLTPTSAGRARYTHAVREQVRALAPRLCDDGYQPRIMYWGGGTASILTCDEIESLHSGLASELDLGGLAEATIEGSPESFDLDKLRLLRRLGFGRISIGVQSLDDHRIRRIGRSHDAEQAVRSVYLAREAGFDNVNIDLIVGFPGEGPGEVEASVSAAATLPVNHFSVYPYRASPGTVLRRQADDRTGHLGLDEQLEAYRTAAAVLEACGHPEYAMSYFGAPHCLSDEAYYQLRMDWVGFGSGANSLLGQRYLATTKGRLHQYNEDPTAVDVDMPAATPSLTAHFLSQALTTVEGMDARLFEERTGVPLRTACSQPEVMGYLQRMSRYGRLVVDRGGIRLRREDMAATYVALSRIDAAEGAYSEGGASA